LKLAYSHIKGIEIVGWLHMLISYKYIDIFFFKYSQNHFKYKTQSLHSIKSSYFWSKY